ncbi:hypothetical protein [Lentzea kentuckyensis]|uniref:hypothetical protein n=1 Tax=Lentzea kentuckyensis TaxID=360086 RepID=UPI0013024EFD|nr:hypothetical protein [Lentzea kentuckyensis]
MQSTLALLAAAGVTISVSAVAQAVPGAEFSVAAERPCGASKQRHFPDITTWDIYYRHCTSGSDSVHVRAVIDWGSDGDCKEVTANETRKIAEYTNPSEFSHIRRC